MELTADNVEAVIADCLFKDDELPNMPGSDLPDLPEDTVKVEGIVNNYAFHGERLESHRRDVRTMLEDLSDEYRLSGGGGTSFLNMCMQRDGIQWTGLHRTQEHLCALAIGLKLGQWALPREMWGVFYGGMPYFTILDTSEEWVDAGT